MKIPILLTLAVVIGLYGCASQGSYQSVPSDLKIEAYTDCSLSFKEWDEKIIIDSAGRGTYEQASAESKVFQLNEEELSSLLSHIEQSGFFKLEGERSEDTCIYDFCEVLGITQNGTTKKFINDGCNISAFDEPYDLIWKMMRNKTNTTIP